jgi:hypothetical protein
METTTKAPTGADRSSSDCSPLRYFEGLNWAVFNCRDYDKRKGREAVKSSFGEAGWEKVRDRMKSGIMEIFQHPPTPETKLYAETVGHSADHRAFRENSNIKDSQDSNKKDNSHPHQ